MTIVNDAYAVTPDHIEWDEVHPDGTKSATLVGTREVGVAFTYTFWIPAGFWDGAHSHSAAAHLVVAQGELRLGYGASERRDATSRFPTGSFVYVPAGAIHYDGAEIDTLLIGTAVGPWATEYIQPSSATLL